MNKSPIGHSSTKRKTDTMTFVFVGGGESHSTMTPQRESKHMINSQPIDRQLEMLQMFSHVKHNLCVILR